MDENPILLLALLATGVASGLILVHALADVLAPLPEGDDHRKQPD